jgi:uncharacterized protein YrzB (UPF0473 family)
MGIFPVTREYSMISSSWDILLATDNSPLILRPKAGTISIIISEGGSTMSEDFGSDFMTIVDEDGSEYELEVLSTLEYNGATYLAVIPAGAEEGQDLEVSILKSVEEDDGESILCAIEDEQELEAVYELIMQELYEEEDDEE